MAEFLPTTITHLECSKCGERHSHEKLQNLCACGGPFLARYDLAKAARTLTREALKSRPANMWRYAEVLPACEAVSLGEGMTPVIHARRLGARMGLDALYVKDEGLNPTGSFKARGLSAAVTRAKELGAKSACDSDGGQCGRSAGGVRGGGGDSVRDRDACGYA